MIVRSAFTLRRPAVDELIEVLEQQAQDFIQLEELIRRMRGQNIRLAVALGVPSKEIASIYGVSSGRISQIAPRKKAKKKV